MLVAGNETTATAVLEVFAMHREVPQHHRTNAGQRAHYEDGQVDPGYIGL
jgi:hypothetical protein